MDNMEITEIFAIQALSLVMGMSAIHYPYPYDFLIFLLWIPIAIFLSVKTTEES